ncbi:hypothetical protein [Commensalibacter communis]|nr:hypothetical protein [Commensalibacter communis]
MNNGSNSGKKLCHEISPCKVHEDPSPILVEQPRAEYAEDYSKS